MRRASGVVGEDHFLNGVLAFDALLGVLEILEEHVLGAAEADAFGAHFAGLAGVLRRVGIGAHAEAAHLSAHFISVSIGFRQFGRDKVNLAGVDEPSPPSSVTHSPSLTRLPPTVIVFVAIVNVELFGADDAALAPAACDDCGVAGLASSGGKDSLRDGHAADVFRAGFAANQNHFLALLGPLLGLVSGEDHFADRGAGNGVDAGAAVCGCQILARAWGR